MTVNEIIYQCFAYFDKLEYFISNFRIFEFFLNNMLQSRAIKFLANNIFTSIALSNKLSERGILITDMSTREFVYPQLIL